MAKREKLLAEIQMASSNEVEAKDRLRRAVKSAHAAGICWSDIAQYLGTSERAARARFDSPALGPEQPPLF